MFCHGIRRVAWSMVTLLLFWLPGVPGGWSGAADLLEVHKGEGGKSIISFDREVEGRVRTLLRQAGLSYPLENGLSLLVFKEEKRMELWSHEQSGPRLVKAYPVTAMSGHAGPKRRRGDHQVPEGIYQVIWLNPNSRFHLSLKIDYPNSFDLQMAREEGRTDLGGDIFIHGGADSVGCVAIGDAAIEELFVLTLIAGNGPAEVIIAPYDLRQHPERAARPEAPSWLPTLYQEISSRLAYYPVAGALAKTPADAPSAVVDAPPAVSAVTAVESPPAVPVSVPVAVVENPPAVPVAVVENPPAVTAVTVVDKPASVPAVTAVDKPASISAVTVVESPPVGPRLTAVDKPSAVPVAVEEKPPAAPVVAVVEKPAVAAVKKRSGKSSAVVAGGSAAASAVPVAEDPLAAPPVSVAEYPPSGLSSLAVITGVENR
ncbi:MAG: L,D-transpeptidase family protein [Magnetococcus sp. YQC-3]